VASDDGRRRVLVLDASKPRFRQAAPGFAAVCDFHSVPSIDAAPGAGPVLMGEVAAAMQKHDFTHVVATSESNMLKAAWIRSSLGLPGPAYDEILPVTDKWRMKQAVRHGVPAARGWLSSAVVTGRVQLPGRVVIKPTVSSSARGVEVMTSSVAVARLRQESALWLVEEAVDVDEELHCDGVLREGQVLWSTVSVYDRPVLHASGSRGSLHLPPDDLVVAAAGRVVRAAFDALPVRDGVFHLELFRRPGGDLLFGEVGLRPAGGGVATSLKIATGVDLWEHFLALQLGIELPPPAGALPPGRQTGVLMIRQASALPHTDIAAMPGVAHVEEGNTGFSGSGAHSCDCSHYVYVDAAGRAELARITDAVGGVRFPARLSGGVAPAAPG
jgi:hypothetical protein